MASQVRGQPQPHPTSLAAPLLAQGLFSSSQKAPEAMPFLGPCGQSSASLGFFTSWTFPTCVASHGLEVCLHHQLILTHS